MSQWEAQQSSEQIQGVSKSEASEALAYFSKRNRSVVECLQALVD